MLNFKIAAKHVPLDAVYVYVVEEDNVGLIDIVDLPSLETKEKELDKTVDAEELLVK